MRGVGLGRPYSHREGMVIDLINKDGLPVHHSAKQVFEELMRGTGCVMGDKLSIFIEAESFSEKYIVVAKAPEAGGAMQRQKFAANQFKEAWGLFVAWMPG